MYADDSIIWYMIEGDDVKEIDTEQSHWEKVRKECRLEIKLKRHKILKKRGKIHSNENKRDKRSR